MNKSKFYQLFRPILLACLLTIVFSYIHGQSQLKTLFLSPPEDAKPRGYWLFGQGNYDYSRITEELKSYKEMGYGGLDIFDLGIVNANKNVPGGPAFMSTEQLDGVVFALTEAKKLGLKMGMSVSNGWNAGGEWTTQDEMSMNMLFWKDTIHGPIKISKVGFPVLPTSFTKIYGVYPLFPLIAKDGFPDYYENISLVAYPFRKDGVINDLGKVITFDAKKIQGNTVNIEIPAGKWVVERSIVTPMGQKMWAASVNSHGYIMDHFSHKATEHHFIHLFNRLEERLGNLKETSLERFYLASFESEAPVEWSPALADSFYKYNGYRIEPYIPALSGQIVVNNDVTQRFIHDYRVCISNMFVSNHYKQARQICNDHGIQIASESGGPGPPLHRVPTEDYLALEAVDVMRGEYWNMKSMTKDSRGGELLSVIKNIAGAAHVYGRKIVEMESFTSQGKHWRENPLDLKKLADYAFCNGMTRVVYHTGTLSPKEAGLPGWTYGAGTHISPNLTWWSLSKPLHTYFARVSALLQQGNFVADVAYYKGQDMPNFSIGYKYTKENLGMGYDYDDINTDILLKTNEVENGKIKLPCGMTYSILVLNPNGKMNIEVVRKIEELLQKGATIIGNKPITVYGLSNFKERENEMKLLADKIWGTSTITKQIRKYGKGFIVTGYTEREILIKKGIETDFSVLTNSKISKIDFIHRSTGYEEIYFVSNSDSVSVNAQLQFRVKGMQPQLWNPLTGEMTTLAVYNQSNNSTNLPLKLEANGSVFIVFSKEIPQAVHVTSVSKSGVPIFPASRTEIKPFNFDISALSIKKSSMITSEEGIYNLTYSNGTDNTISVTKGKEFILSGSWDVRFTHGWGFSPIQKMDTLVDWVKHPNTALSHYSGLASYKLAFTLPFDFLTNDNIYQLDLGRVGEVARVYLNGEEVGTSLFPPHCLNLGHLLRKGENNIVIEVANTWLNQYLADSKKPVLEQRLSTNVSKSDFIKNGDKPLPSGLMGTVRIIANASFLLNDK